jgi:hypothetical protein
MENIFMSSVNVSYFLNFNELIFLSIFRFQIVNSLIYETLIVTYSQMNLTKLLLLNSRLFGTVIDYRGSKVEISKIILKQIEVLR